MLPILFEVLIAHVSLVLLLCGPTASDRGRLTSHARTVRPCACRGGNDAGNGAAPATRADGLWPSTGTTRPAFRSVACPSSCHHFRVRRTTGVTRTVYPFYERLQAEAGPCGDARPRRRTLGGGAISRPPWRAAVCRGAARARCTVRGPRGRANCGARCREGPNVLCGVARVLLVRHGGRGSLVRGPSPWRTGFSGVPPSVRCWGAPRHGPAWAGGPRLEKNVPTR